MKPEIIINAKAAVLEILQFPGTLKRDKKDPVAVDQTNVAIVHKRQILARRNGIERGMPERSSVTGLKDTEVRTANNTLGLRATAGTRVETLEASTHPVSMVESLITILEEDTIMTSSLWKQHSVAHEPASPKIPSRLLRSLYGASILH